jgi:hypothetical protein
MSTKSQTLIGALQEMSDRVGVSLDKIAQSIGGIDREQLPLFKNAISDPREEVILCYTVGTLRFVPFKVGKSDERYGILDMNLYYVESDLQEVNGRYRVIWKPEPVSVAELYKRPRGYTGPWDEVVEPIPQHLPMRANSHAAYTFDGIGTIYATGPANLLLVPLTDEAHMFLISVATFVTGGTGAYEGCSGVNTAMGSSFIPKGQDVLNAPFGVLIPGVTVSAFRVVRAPHIGKQPKS